MRWAKYLVWAVRILEIVSLFLVPFTIQHMYLHAECSNYPKRIVGGGGGCIWCLEHHYFIEAIDKYCIGSNVEYYSVALGYNGTTATIWLTIINSTMYPCLDNHTVKFTFCFKPCYWNNNTVVVECANCFIKLFDLCLIYHGFYYAGIPYSFAVECCNVVLLNIDVIAFKAYLFRPARCSDVYVYGWAYMGTDNCDGKITITEINNEPQDQVFVYRFEFDSADQADAFVNEVSNYLPKYTPKFGKVGSMVNELEANLDKIANEYGGSLEDKELYFDSGTYTYDELADKISTYLVYAYDDLPGNWSGDTPPFPTGVAVDEGKAYLTDGYDAVDAFDTFLDPECER